MFNRKNLFLALILFFFVPVFVSADCFSPGTLVQMADGSTKPIEKVEAGDKIIGYDVKKKEFTTNIVKELQSPMKPWIEIFLANGTILNTTDDHPFFSKEHDYWASFDPEETWQNNHFILPEQLEVGQHIMNLNEEFLEILDVKYHSEEIKTYNLKRVSNNNTFFADGFLVHNRDIFDGGNNIGGGSSSTACSSGSGCWDTTGGCCPDPCAANWTSSDCSNDCGYGTKTMYYQNPCTGAIYGYLTVGCIGTDCSDSTEAAYVSTLVYTANINKSNYLSAENLNMNWAAQLMACANAYYNYGSSWKIAGTVNGVSKTAISTGMWGGVIYASSLGFTVEDSTGSYNALFGGLSIPYTVTNPYSCTGANPLNATMCSNDNIGLTANTAKTVTASCSSNLKCEYICNIGYHPEAGVCVPDCVPKTCDSLIPKPECGNPPDGCLGNLTCGNPLYAPNCEVIDECYDTVAPLGAICSGDNLIETYEGFQQPETCSATYSCNTTNNSCSNTTNCGLLDDCINTTPQTVCDGNKIITNQIGDEGVCNVSGCSTTSTICSTSVDETCEVGETCKVVDGTPTCVAKSTTWIEE